MEKCRQCSIIWVIDHNDIFTVDRKLGETHNNSSSAIVQPVHHLSWTMFDLDSEVNDQILQAVGGIRQWVALGSGRH